MRPQFDGPPPPNVLQPASATFAIWWPIFGTSLWHAAVQARPDRADDPILRAVGGPAAVAYAATASWAPLLRARRYWSAQLTLFVIAGSTEIARRRVAAIEANGDLAADLRRVVAPPVGMLAAWGAAASMVNLGAMMVDSGLVRQGRPARVVGALLTILTASSATILGTTSAGGNSTTVGRIYLGTVAWALAGIVAGQRRQAPGVAAAAAAGLIVVSASALPRLKQRSASDARSGR